MKVVVFFYLYWLSGNIVSVWISKLKLDGREYDNKMVFMVLYNCLKRYFVI